MTPQLLSETEKNLITPEIDLDFWVVHPKHEAGPALERSLFISIAITEHRVSKRISFWQYTSLFASLVDIRKEF
jgi:hypothetical protein